MTGVDDWHFHLFNDHCTGCRLRRLYEESRTFYADEIAYVVQLIPAHSCPLFAQCALLDTWEDK